MMFFEIFSFPKFKQRQMWFEMNREEIEKIKFKKYKLPGQFFMPNFKSIFKLLNRYIMKIKSHNSTANTSCEEDENCFKDKVTRRRLNKGKGVENRKENIPTNNGERDNILTNNGERDVNREVRSAARQVDPVAQYEKQILKYIRDRSQDFKVSSLYIRNHQFFSHKTRKTKIKYFFKVAQRFKLKRTTVHLAIYYLDAFLEKYTNLEKSELVFIVQAALFIAMKYEEIYPPELYQWTTNHKKIIEAESLILKTLDFNLSYTSLEHYNEFFMSKLQLSDHSKKLVKMTIDTCLFDENMYKQKAQDLALAILYSVTRPEKVEQKMNMTIKWMLERCQDCLEWVQENCKY